MGGSVLTLQARKRSTSQNHMMCVHVAMYTIQYDTLSESLSLYNQTS